MFKSVSSIVRTLHLPLTLSVCLQPHSNWSNEKLFFARFLASVCFFLLLFRRLSRFDILRWGFHAPIYTHFCAYSVRIDKYFINSSYFREKNREWRRQWIGSWKCNKSTESEREEGKRARTQISAIFFSSPLGCCFLFSWKNFGPTIFDRTTELFSQRASTMSMEITLPDEERSREGTGEGGGRKELIFKMWFCSLKIMAVLILFGIFFIHCVEIHSSRCHCCQLACLLCIAFLF